MKYASHIDHAALPSFKERQERRASAVIWLVLWVGCAAPFFSLFWLVGAS